MVGFVLGLKVLMIVFGLLGFVCMLVLWFMVISFMFLGMMNLEGMMFLLVFCMNLLNIGVER